MAKSRYMMATTAKQMIISERVVENYGSIFGR